MDHVHEGMEYLLELVAFMSFNDAMFIASIEQGLISGLMKTVLNLANSIEDLKKGDVGTAKGSSAFLITNREKIK